MRLSPEKQIHLAQVIAKRILAMSKKGSDLEAKGSEVAIRTKALDTLRAFVKRDEQMAEAARQKIRSLQRAIPEGSAEYEALFRQHYQHEMDRLRKVK